VREPGEESVRECLETLAENILLRWKRTVVNRANIRIQGQGNCMKEKVYLTALLGTCFGYNESGCNEFMTIPTK
jgi:hypothetical protein